ncbi:MAG TPA: glycosyltransferase family 39 protein [Gemmatimonadales bacterium]|nr:glycosyltransferase family 39 protein [Gemmatimonadales bacterium]
MERPPRLIARSPWEAVRQHPVSTLVGLALVLRLATLTWGAQLGPYAGWYHADESKVWRSVAGFPHIYLSNQNYLYGTAVQYTAGILLFPFKRLWLSGHPLFPALSYEQFTVLAIRALHALLGALTVGLLYQLARQLWDRTTALLAAALLAVSFYHVLNSAFATLDVPMSFLATLGILLSARADRSLAPANFAGLGVVLGYMAGTKVTGGSLAIVPVVLALSAPHPKRPQYVRGLILAAFVAALVFVLSTPHAVLRAREYLAFMREQQYLWVERYDHGPLAILRIRLAGMARVLTPPVALLAIVGLAVGRASPGASPAPSPESSPTASKAGSHAARRLEWAVLAYLALDVVIWRAYLPDRFVLPTVPLLCAYAARPLALLLESGRPGIRRTGAALTATALGISVAAVLGGIWTRWHDTRSEAARDIARIVPSGATLAFVNTAQREPWTVHAWRYPRVDSTRVRLVSPADSPDFLVVTDWTRSRMEAALHSGQMGPDYVWPDSLANVWYHYLVPTPDDFRLHADLAAERGYREIGRWDPVTSLPVEFAGKRIWLYRRTGGAQN